MAAVALSIAASSVTVPGGEPPQARAQTDERPNILVIVTDDQRIGTLRVMPRTRRWFQRGGRRFTNAFVTTPLCCPSRASILSGRYAHNHGVLTNDDPTRLDQDATLQAHLRGAGYRTAIAGKMLNRWPLERNPEHFDRWAIFNHGYYDARFNVNGTLRDVPRYSTDFVARRAVRFLRTFEQQGDEPWFLYVAPFAPHGPSTPARRHEDARIGELVTNPAMRETDVSDKAPVVQELARFRRVPRAARVRQLRTLIAVDELVERIMSELGRQGERGRTLAFFISDNGLFWGEHRLRGKWLPYRMAYRVPLLMRWPERVARRTRDDRLAANVDLAPTIYEAAGVAGPEVDGRSLLGEDRRDRLLLEGWHPNRKPHAWSAYLDPARQYVEFSTVGTGEVVFREYYDLVNDPWQLVNVLGDSESGNEPSAEELHILSLQMRRDRSCAGTAGPSACP